MAGVRGNGIIGQLSYLGAARFHVSWMAIWPTGADGVRKSRNVIVEVPILPASTQTVTLMGNHGSGKRSWLDGPVDMCPEPPTNPRWISGVTGSRIGPRR